MEQRLCTGCGKHLNKPRPNQRYHDSKCKQAAYRARDNPIPNGPPLVVLAGVDTLYLNVYYADPERYTRIEKPLDEDLQAFFTETQRMAKTSHKEVEMDWMLDATPMTMTPEQSAKLLATFHTEQANAQRIGQTVLILMGEYQNTLGKVYAYLPGREHPWLVRPESWPQHIPGIAYTSEELAFGCSKATVRVACEVCGVLFEPEHGYYEVDQPEHQRIGYAYCSECCHW